MMHPSWDNGPVIRDSQYFSIVFAVCFYRHYGFIQFPVGRKFIGRYFMGYKTKCFWFYGGYSPWAFIRYVWWAHFRATKVSDRYANCRYWDSGRCHAAWRAVLRPYHANENLLPDGLPID